MKRFVLLRLAYFVPQLLALAVGVFLLLRLLPVDPVSRIVGSIGTKESYATAKHALGLDRSLWHQLTDYVAGLPTLDFGNSYKSSDPVRTELAERIPVTLTLIMLGFFLALAISIPLGRYVATHVGSRTERATSGYAMFAGAQPDFWWGLIFVYVFFFLLGWAPAPLGLLDPAEIAPDGPTNFILVDTLIHGQVGLFFSALGHLALPVLTQAFVMTGPLLKIMRQSATDVLGSDYLLYAEAAGLEPKRKRRWVRRNSLAPVVTISGILFVFALGGSVLIETVFSLNGLGRYALQSTLDTDFPAIQGSVAVMAFLGLLMYLLMDVLYAVLDPRVRYGGS